MPQPVSAPYGLGTILVYVQDDLRETQDKLKTAQREVSRLKSSLNTSRAEIEAARNDGASAAKFNEQELRHAAESKLAVAQQTLQRQTTFITDLKQRVGCHCISPVLQSFQCSLIAKTLNTRAEGVFHPHSHSLQSQHCFLGTV